MFPARSNRGSLDCAPSSFPRSVVFSVCSSSGPNAVFHRWNVGFLQGLELLKYQKKRNMKGQSIINFPLVLSMLYKHRWKELKVCNEDYCCWEEKCCMEKCRGGEGGILSLTRARNCSLLPKDRQSYKGICSWQAREQVGRTSCRLHKFIPYVSL